MTLPALARLRASREDARFLLLAPGSLSARVYVLSGLVDQAEVEVLPEGNAGIVRRMSRLRQSRPDAVVLWSGGFVWALGARLTGAPIRAGLASDGRAWLLTHAFPEQATDVHQSQVCLGISDLALDALGVPVVSQKSPFPLPVRTEGVRDPRCLVVIPSASRPDKIWPVENFQHVIRNLVAEGVFGEILVAGSPAETTLCRTLADLPGVRAVRALNAELENLAAIFSTAGFALGNTTGLAHLAAACGCRVLALSGEPGQDRGAPACPGCRSLGNPDLPPNGKKRGSREILAAITPDMVLDQLRTMTAEGSLLE